MRKFKGFRRIVAEIKANYKHRAALAALRLRFAAFASDLVSVSPAALDAAHKLSRRSAGEGDPALMAAVIWRQACAATFPGDRSDGFCRFRIDLDRLGNIVCAPLYGSADRPAGMGQEYLFVSSLDVAGVEVETYAEDRLKALFAQRGVELVEIDRALLLAVREDTKRRLGHHDPIKVAERLWDWCRSSLEASIALGDKAVRLVDAPFNLVAASSSELTADRDRPQAGQTGTKREVERRHGRVLAYPFGRAALARIGAPVLL